MNAMTLSFDFAGMAINKIHYVQREDRNAAKKVAVTKRVATLIPSFLSALVGFIVAKHIDRKARSLVEIAIFLEGASYSLTQEIAVTHSLPGNKLVAALDDFIPRLYETTNSCEQAAKFFQTRRPQSPIAVAFEKVVLAIKRVSSASVLLRAVATGSSVAGVSMPYAGVASWDDAVQQQRNAFNSVRARIFEGDTSDIDPELLELAAQAIRASDSRDLANDHAWVGRMSHSTMH